MNLWSIFELVAAAICVVCFILGIVKRIGAKQFEATVLDFEQESGNLFPVFEFEFDGQIVKKTGTRGYKPGKAKLNPGDKATILFKDIKQKDVLVKGDYFDLITFAIGMVCFAVFGFASMR